MSEYLPLITIELTPRFKKDLKELAKRYPCIRQDIEALVNQLQQGEILGEQIKGIKYQVFKVRVKNSNIQKGKSGGYRVIYYLKTKTAIILTTIYSKSDFSDVSNSVIEDAIARYESILNE